MSFVLDEAINFVINEKTKLYLRESISDYYNNNYRSCIVSLYTTVIFDFINKLMKLRDLYNDGESKKMLDEIKNLQELDKPYSEVEKKIIDAIEKIKLLNAIEMEQVYSLKAARNNAAHPVFKNEYELIEPTKEQTLAHLRNMFDAVFTRDIVVSKKILNDFRADICDFYNRQPNLNNFDIFLHNRYYKRFNIETKKYIFREIWKNSFWFDDDENCNNNRKVLVKTLLLFANWDKILFLDYFKEHNEVLCRKIKVNFIDNSFDGIDFYDLSCKSFILFLEENSDFYLMIPEDKKVEIYNICIQSPNLCLQAEFLFKDAEDYFNAVFGCIKELKITKPCLNSTTLLKKYNKHRQAIGSKIRRLFNTYYSENTYSTTWGYDFDYINWIYSDLL